MSSDNTALSSIPPPAVVRDRLADALRETRLLRALLKLSERAEQERVRRAAQSEDPARA